MENLLKTTGSTVYARPVLPGGERRLFLRCAALLSCISSLTTGVVFAHDDKPKHGGVLSVENDVAYELVVKEDRIDLFVNDHDTPVSLTGASGHLVVGVGKNAARYPFKQIESDGLAAVGAKWPVGEKATIALKMRSGRHVVVTFSQR